MSSVDFEPVLHHEVVAPSEVPAEISAEELARHELSAHLAQVGTYQSHSVEVRKDFTGYASEKVQVGGAMFVRCTLLTQDGPRIETLEINDGFRPLSDSTLAHLGAVAHQTGAIVYRDYANAV